MERVQAPVTASTPLQDAPGIIAGSLTLAASVASPSMASTSAPVPRGTKNRKLLVIECSHVGSITLYGIRFEHGWWVSWQFFFFWVFLMVIKINKLENPGHRGEVSTLPLGLLPQGT